MTQTLGLGEPTTDAIIAKLQAGYTARVNTINGADTQGITLGIPTTADYYFDGVNQVPRYPAIVVAQTPTDNEDEAEGPYSFIWVADFVIAVYDVDTNRSMLGRRLKRHARAIREVLLYDSPARQLAGGNAFRLDILRDNPGPVGDPTGEPVEWVGVHLIYARIWRTEGND